MNCQPNTENHSPQEPGKSDGPMNESQRQRQQTKSNGHAEHSYDTSMFVQALRYRFNFRRASRRESLAVIGEIEGSAGFQPPQHVLEFRLVHCERATPAGNTEVVFG